MTDPSKVSVYEVSWNVQVGPNSDGSFGWQVWTDHPLWVPLAASGLRDGEVAIVDKDGNLAGATTSAMYGPPDESLTREWVLMGWWWLSDVAKYLHRGTHFEAAERIALVRQQALRLFAAANAVPYPAFGLTSLVDYPPYELPAGLAATYRQPDDRRSLVVAAAAAADLLDACSARAEAALGHNLSTRWTTTARARLEAATRARSE